MIYTLTLNPAIDMNVVSDTLVKDTTTRTREMVLTPNGKGINVARVLDHFGVPTAVMGFFGGFTGRYIVEACQSFGIKTVPVMVEGETRINTFLATSDGEYKMVNSGFAVSEDDKAEMLSCFDGLDDIDILTINGSALPNIDLDYYEKLISTVQKKGARVVLDISNSYLAELLKYKPLLIKPNDEEIEKIFGIKIDGEDSVRRALETLHSLGAQNILLTLGKNGSFFYNGKELYRCGTKQVKLRSSLCAGDGFLAAFLAKWAGDEDNVEEALRYASATGANVAECDGIGDLANVELYAKEISVMKI